MKDSAVLVPIVKVQCNEPFDTIHRQEEIEVLQKVVHPILPDMKFIQLREQTGTQRCNMGGFEPVAGHMVRRSSHFHIFGQTVSHIQGYIGINK